MMKKINCLAVMLLVAHGTVLSMMHSKKLLRGYGNTIKLSRFNSNSPQKIDSLEKIAQSLENIEKKLAEQNRLSALHIRLLHNQEDSWYRDSSLYTAIDDLKRIE